jgi:hypothetical protein
MLFAVILLAVVGLVGLAVIAIRRRESEGADIRLVERKARNPPLFAQYRRW